jgi:hypothetical protein
MYNVTLRRVRATIVAVESNEYYTTSVCGFVALGIQQAMRMRYTVICGLRRSTIFFHIITQTVRFSEGELLNPKSVLRFYL